MKLKSYSLIKILTVIFLTATLICCQNNKQKKVLSTTKQLSLSTTNIDHQKKKKKNKHHHNQNNKLKTINNNQEITNEKEELKVNNNEIINDEHDQQNDENKIKTIIDKQEKVINDIKEEIDHLDVNNNAINNEQKRLQHCHDLINKINDYQNNQEVYQLLLPWQKELIIKQKLIKHYHQSLFSKIITILISIFNIIIYIIYFNFFLLIFFNFKIINSKIFNKYFKINNFKNGKKMAFWFFTTMFVIFIINTSNIINHFFNNNNERLFNSIMNTFFYRHTIKIKINKCLFIDEKQVGYFLYDHSYYLTNNQQKYYYVPLLFDNLSNWFLTSYHIINTLFFIIMFVFFIYFNIASFKERKNDFITEITKIMTEKNFEKYSTSITIDKIIDKIIEDTKNNFKIDEKKAINKIISSSNNNRKYYDEFTRYFLVQIAKKHFNYDNLLNLMMIFLFLVIFPLTISLFDYAHTFFHGENNKQPHFLTIVFYWQHCFNELIKNLFKSLPIIRNHYFMQPSLCKFWYPIILSIIHPLISVSILFLNDLLIYKKIMVNKKIFFIEQENDIEDLFLDLEHYSNKDNICNQFFHYIFMNKKILIDLFEKKLNDLSNSEEEKNEVQKEIPLIKEEKKKLSFIEIKKTKLKNEEEKDNENENSFNNNEIKINFQEVDELKKNLGYNNDNSDDNSNSHHSHSHSDSCSSN